jgi:aspartate racemase
MHSANRPAQPAPWLNAPSPQAPSTHHPATPAPATKAVGILGGMGPAAGAQFTQLFVQACADELLARGRTVHDQAYPEHWLCQVPVADRTQAILAEDPGDASPPSTESPLPGLAYALTQLDTLGVRAVAMACNTAHHWHADLQQRFAHLELLHIADEVASSLHAQGHERALLLATSGTLRSGLYARALARRGITCVLPPAAQQACLMAGIYDGVKRGDMDLARDHFEAVLDWASGAVVADCAILGCTEIPLAQPASNLPLVDPNRLLARALARRAYSA